MENLKVDVAKIDDVKGLINVRHDTWINTYPNPKLGITVEDLEAKLKEEVAGGEEKNWIDRITKDPSCKVWVARNGNKVIGFISVQKLQNKNKMWALYVLPDFQNKGIGKKLMRKALEWLGNDKRVILEVASYNSRAIDFYKSYGFVESGPANNPVGNLPSGKTIPEILMIKEGENK